MSAIGVVQPDNVLAYFIGVALIYVVFQCLSTRFPKINCLDLDDIGKSGLALLVTIRLQSAVENVPR